MGDEFVLKAPVEYEDIDETMPEFLLRKAKEHAENGKEVWLEDVVTGEKHTFEDFDSETKSMASFMYKHGMRLGDTAIYMTNDLVKANLFFVGVWRANGAIRASYPEDDADTLLFRVEESRVGWILCDPEHVSMCQEVAAKVYWDVEVIVTSDDTEDMEGVIAFKELFEDDGSECPEIEYRPNRAALILCTSGTTGRSKGAIHSHKSFLNGLNVVNLYGPITDDEPNLFMSKATHITGTMFPFVCLMRGAMALVMPKITKQNLFESVDKYKPVFVWGFPTFLLQMINDPDAGNYDFTSIRIIGSGGAIITPAMQSALQQLPNMDTFINVYGLTETCPVTMESDFENPPNKIEGSPPFSTGKVVPGAVITIRNPDTGEVLGPNERGEICIKTERNFVGYINNEKATQDSFIDGYFRTGDIGYFDENEFIFLVDRLKEIFKYFNNHISPTELEDVIMQHEAVTEVCVIGIPDPDGGGHIPRACVTVNSDEVTTDDILEFANGQLPDYKHIRGGIFIVPELPKGKTGKVSRNLVAEMELPE